MNQYILDASVGIKWIFSETGSDHAYQLHEQIKQRKIEAIVPEFFFVELANACWVKFRKRLCSFELASQALDQTLDLSLTTYSDRELSDVAFENAVRFGISAYDALYISLAEVYFAPLVTADEPLLAACRGKFDFIESLEEFAEGK